MYMHAKRSHMPVKDVSDSEFGGIWEQQNNPACTKSVKSLQNVEVGHYTNAEKEEVYVADGTAKSSK